MDNQPNTAGRSASFSAQHINTGMMANMDSMNSLAAQESQGAPAQSQPQNGVATIQQIGSLLSSVTDLAQNAQHSFLNGQHEQSSTYLSDLQQRLLEIGELGAQSLAMVHERGQSFSGGLPLERSPSHGHRRTMTESAVKKRPFVNSLDEMDFSAFKTQRPDEASIRPDGQIPSAPPHLSISGAGTHSNLQVSTPVQGIEQPPSAPPYLASEPTTQSSGSIPVHRSFGPSTSSASSQAGHLEQSPLVPQGSFTFAHPHGVSSTFEQSATSTPSTGAVSLSYTDSQSRTAPTDYNSMSQQYSMPPSPQEMSGHFDKSFDQMAADITPHVEPRLRSHTSSRSLGGIVNQIDDDVAESGLLASERGMSGAIVPPELKANLDRIFFLFLEKVCSDVNFCDGKGEHLHQILTAKKMNRASVGSGTFKAFKFRIQAFTNAFHEEVERHLGSECVFKQTRAYLWTSNYIARFNESGVKEKSKGNHVWRVEARKNFDNRFEFREFKRKIITPAQVAYHGLEWSWPLRIWDPQSPSTSIKAVFNCGNLPHWIKWKDDESNVLHGVPDASCPSTQLTVEAHYVSRGQQQLVRLSATVELQVMPLVEAPAQHFDASGLATDGDQSFEDLQVRQAESIVAESQVAQVMSQLSFPFTPPVSVAGRQPFFFGDEMMQKRAEDAIGSDLNVRQPLPTAPLPQSRDSMQPFEQIQQNQIRDLLSRQERAAATMQLNMPPIRRKSAAQTAMHHQQNDQTQQQQPEQETQAQTQAQAQANAQMQAQFQASMAGTPMQMPTSQAPIGPSAMHGMTVSGGPAPVSMPANSIDASLLASSATTMPGLPTHGTPVQHPGLTLTPMSSLPQLAATLPQLTSNSQNPMLSPALPMGFDPIASEGARIHAMQIEQERQRQQSHAQQQYDVAQHAQQTQQQQQQHAQNHTQALSHQQEQSQHHLSQFQQQGEEQQRHHQEQQLREAQQFAQRHYMAEDQRTRAQNIDEQIMPSHQQQHFEHVQHMQHQLQAQQQEQQQQQQQ